MSQQATPIPQGRAFSTIFLIEMWERFGYYGMQVLLVTYMIKKLGFVDTHANLVYGAATALIYTSPVIGGWIGDRWIGTRRTMLIGAVVLVLGYALLWVPTEEPLALYFALGVIIVGNGLFKPNTGNLVRKIYEGEDSRIDSAFTLYYMAVNVGSMVSMTLTPWVRDVVGEAYGSSAGWHTAFGVCSVGLLLGLANYAMMRRALANVGSPPDREPLVLRRALAVAAGCAAFLVGSMFILQSVSLARVCVYGAAVVLAGIFTRLIRKAQPGERAGLIATAVLVAQTILYFIFYQQMATSLNLFAQHNVDLDFRLFGWRLFTWIPEQFQNLNSIWIVLLSPLMAMLYNALGRQGGDLSIAAKFVWGFACVALGFFIYSFGALWAVQGQVSSWVMVWGYGLISLGELLVGGLGLAMIARYAPQRMGGFLMGAYFLSIGISQYLGSVVANFAHIPENLTDPVESLAIYTHLFNMLGYLGIAGTVLAMAMLPFMKRLSAGHAQARAAG
jgi:POT family proton-dependent oligopeptide transporter